MNVEYINPFISSAVTVFRTMLSMELQRGPLSVKRGLQPNHDISGVIGLSGRARGTIVLSLSREAAIEAASRMLGERPLEINADVADAIGELTNMIAGSAKAQLEHLSMSVSLPSVVTGKSHCIEFPRHVTPICIPFDTDHGSISVEVGLVEKVEEEHAAEHAEEVAV